MPSCAGFPCRTIQIAPREIELTSYSEVVLAPAASDRAHPAFSNLFIETQFDYRDSACSRNAARAPPKTSPCGAFTCWRCRRKDRRHAVRNRSRAISWPRAHDCRSDCGNCRPASFEYSRAVLDPIFSLRWRVRLQPNETAKCTSPPASQTRASMRRRWLTNITRRGSLNVNHVWPGRGRRSR